MLNGNEQNNELRLSNWSSWFASMKSHWIQIRIGIDWS